MPRRQPTPIFVPFIDTGTLRDITISNIDQITLSPVSGSVTPTDPHIPQIISNLNQMPFYSGADITAYDVTTQWTPMSSGHIVKLFVNIAVCAEMPTWTDEDIDIDRITVTISEAGTGKVIWENSFAPALDQFNSALEERMFLIRVAIDNQSYQVSQGTKINIRVSSTITQGTGGTDPTFFMGVSPFFPMTADSLSKMFSQSGVVFYVDRDREKL